MAPKYVTIGIVPEDSLVSYKKSRFNFGAHFLANITLRLDGKELPYPTGYNMDYSSKYYQQPYMGMTQELAIPMSNEFGAYLPQIPYDSFDSGFALYVWNCQKHHGLNEQTPSNEMGVLEVVGRFDKGTAENLIIIVMLSYENSYKIDGYRNVTFEEKSSKMTKAKAAK